MSDLWEKLHSGELYDPGNAELAAVQRECMKLLYQYNQTGPEDMEKRRELLRQMFAQVGEGCYIEPPLYANWAGRFVHMGNNVYANFGLTMVDDTYIEIGDNTMFAPHVIIAAGTHPTDPEQRRKGLQYNKPVKIGKNCWIGAGAVILPGVTIGDNTVIGAGSVVTHDIPENCTAVGIPCRVINVLEKKTQE